MLNQKSRRASKRMYRRFAAFVAGLAGTLVLLVGSLNSWIDPFDSESGLADTRFSDARSVDSTRTLKGNQLQQGGWSFVIAGTSRAETGVDPRGEVWKELGNGYNASLPGGNMFEARHVIETALRDDDLQVVVLFVEVVMFGGYRTGVDDFWQSPLAARSLESNWERRLRLWLGARTTQASWQTWRRYSRSDSAPRLQLGFREPPREAPQAWEQSHALAKYYMTAPEAFADFRLDLERLDDLDSVARQCADANVDLYLIVPPVHAWQMVLINQAGLTDQLNTIRRRVAAIADAARSPGSSAIVEAWDFSGYRGLVSEPLPTPLADGPMEYYFEISHFRPRVGDAVIGTIFNRPHPLSKLLLGVRLTAENIEDHLAQQERDRRRFIEQRDDLLGLLIEQSQSGD